MMPLSTMWKVDSASAPKIYGLIHSDFDLPPYGTYPEWLTALQRRLETWVQGRETEMENGKITSLGNRERSGSQVK